MEGNLNNNVNPIPNNNYEPQKSNNGVKVLLVILILLVLCLIGLTCYKMFIYDKKNDNKQNSNVVEEKEDKNNKEETYEKINYEIKDYKHEKDGIEYDEALYVNGKLVEDGFIIKVEQFKDVLIVEETGVVAGYVVYVTKEGEIKKFDYTNHPYGNTLHSPLLTFTYPSLGVYRSYQIVNDEVEFTVSRIGATTSDDNKWLCDSKDEIGEYTIRYKYMGNGNFDVGKIIKEKTVKEIYPNACTSSVSS